MPVIDEIHFIFYDRPPTEQLKTDLNQDREALRLSRPVSDKIVTSSVRHKGFSNLEVRSWLNRSLNKVPCDHSKSKPTQREKLRKLRCSLFQTPQP